MTFRFAQGKFIHIAVTTRHHRHNSKLLDEAAHHMKNYADRGGWRGPPRSA